MKSALILAAMGVGGCVLLSMVMQKAIAIDAGRRQLPFVPALEARFGPQLESPLRVRETAVEGGLELTASARVGDGVAAEPLARAIAAELWVHALRAGSPAASVRVVLRGEDGAPLVALPVPRPVPGRLPAPPR